MCRSTAAKTTELRADAGHGRAAVSRRTIFGGGVRDAAEKCCCWAAAAGLSRHAHESPDGGREYGTTYAEFHAAEVAGGISVWRDDDGAAAAATPGSTAATSTTHVTTAARSAAAATAGDGGDDRECIVTAALAGDGGGAGVGERSVGIVDERGGTRPERLSGVRLDICGGDGGKWNGRGEQFDEQSGGDDAFFELCKSGGDGAHTRQCVVGRKSRSRSGWLGLAGEGLYAGRLSCTGRSKPVECDTSAEFRYGSGYQPSARFERAVITRRPT